MSAYIIGSTLAGLLFGGLLGLMGSGVASVTDSPLPPLVLLFAAALLGLLLDGRALRLRLPTTRRQVNDLWVTRYRGWVYGIGFGFQLGLGVITIVRTSAVYATFLASFLSGSALRGAFIGGLFGAVRGGTALFGVGVRTPERLAALDRAMTSWDPFARRVGIISQAAIALTLGLWLLH